MTRPEWQRIADDIAARIESGEYPNGARLPRFPDLQARYGVGLKTIQTALIALQYVGLVQRPRGKGFYAVWPPERPTSPPPAPEAAGP